MFASAFPYFEADAELGVTSFKSKLQTRYLLALTTKLLTLTELLKAVVMLSSTHSSTSTSATAKTLIVLSLQYHQPELHQSSLLNRGESVIDKARQNDPTQVLLKYTYTQ